MVDQAITFELPAEIAAPVGTLDMAVAKARTALPMGLLEGGTISEG